MIPRRFIIVAQIAATAICIAGCAPKAGHGLNTEVGGTDVRTFSRDPLVAMATIKKLAETQEERDMLWKAYNEQWHEAATLDQQLKVKQAEAQGAQDRANSAEASQQKLQARLAVMLFVGGCVLTLGGIAAVVLGWRMPGIPSGKIGTAAAITGAAMVFASLNLKALGVLFAITASGLAAAVVAPVLSAAFLEIKRQWTSPSLEGK